MVQSAIIFWALDLSLTAIEFIDGDRVTNDQLIHYSGVSEHSQDQC